MKRQKGFTLVEIIVTFCLVSTISFLLFQLILSIKNLYTSSDYKTVLLIEQGNMTRRINTDMFTMPLLKVEDCSTEKNVCWNFTVRDLALDKNVTKKLEVFSDSIVYDGYMMNIDKGTKIGDVSAVVSYLEDSSVTYNAMLTIDIPITNKLVSGNYGIHATIQYNTADAVVEEAAINESHKIEIVTTTVSDIIRKTTNSGDGLYNFSGETWYYGITNKEYYNSVKNDMPKYVFRGDAPNNWVIFNKRCYRMISITADSTLKMIYEGDSDGGRCTDLNSTGSIGNTAYAGKDNNNSWFDASAPVRTTSLPTWLHGQNINMARINGVSNFYVGAVAGDVEVLLDLYDQTYVGKGSSNLPDRKVYADSEFDVGMPSVTDYIFASLNTACNSMLAATTTTRCGDRNFLLKNYDYWTLNADQAGNQNVWAVNKNGSLTSTKATNKLGVRPIIYLKSTTKFSGNGTTSNPYVVK